MPRMNTEHVRKILEDKSSLLTAQQYTQPDLPHTLTMAINPRRPAWFNIETGGGIAMTMRTIFQLGAKCAALVAMAALLLQVCCPALLTAPPAETTVQTRYSGCHESAPKSPSAPSSGHKCCGADHDQDALLNVAQGAPAVLDAGHAGYLQASALELAVSRSVDLASSASGPPGLLPLRI